MTRGYALWLPVMGACVLLNACGPSQEPVLGEELQVVTAPHKENSAARCRPPVPVADLLPAADNILEQVDVDGTLFVSNIEISASGSQYFLWMLEPLRERHGSRPEWRVVRLAGPLPNAPRQLTVVGRTLFFTLDDGIHGEELWKSDGTPEGTVLVADIHPEGSATPHPLFVVHRTLFFVADDGVHGPELWRSDGTEDGTRLVKDLRPGPEGSSPESFSLDGGQHFLFTADDGTHGRELWRSNGTGDGTRLVKDLRPGPEGSSPESLVRVDNHLTFFTADDGIHGRELWRTDGRTNGTRLVEDIRPGPEGSDVARMTLAKRTLYFTANDGVHGTELWVSKGRENDTRLVEDLRPGPEGTRFQEMVPLDGQVVLIADDGLHGFEPWRSDGTPKGTLLLADITPAGLTSPYGTGSLSVAGGKVFFYAFDPVHGYEPWVTDGTPSGTHLVKDIQPGPANSIPGDPSPPIPVRGGVIFNAFTEVSGVEPWWSDGTEEGTKTADLAPGPESSFPGPYYVAGSWVYFSASDGTGGNLVWALPTACFPRNRT